MKASGMHVTTITGIAATFTNPVPQKKKERKELEPVKAG